MIGRLPVSHLLRGFVLLAALATSAGAATPPVTVTVREPAGIERRHWPLTFTVPWARGALKKGEKVSVHDDTGAPLPVQSRALSTWPDGSTRWLLVDTQVELRPNQQRRLRVERGPHGHPGTPLKVTKGAEGIDVDTGALRFSVPRTRFALLDALQPAGEKGPLNGAVGSVLVAGERRGEAQRPTDVRVLEEGSLRTRIALTGTYGNGFDYEIRLDAYAGQPFVRVLHTFINRNPKEFISVPRIAVELPLGELKPSTYRAGIVDGRPRTDAIPDGGLQLVQRDNATAEIGGAAEPLQLAGWIELGSRARQRRRGGALVLAGVSAELRRAPRRPLVQPVGAAGRSRQRRRRRREDARVRDLDRAPDRLPAGVGAALTAPLVGVVDPHAVAASGALADALAPREPGARFIRKAADGARRYLKRNARSSGTTAAACTAPSPGSSACAPARSACGTGAIGTFAAIRTRPKEPTVGATSSTTRPRCSR